jgi:hypothetical protein
LRHPERLKTKGGGENEKESSWSIEQLENQCFLSGKQRFL